VNQGLADADAAALLSFMKTDHIDATTEGKS